MTRWLLWLVWIPRLLAHGDDGSCGAHEMSSKEFELATREIDHYHDSGARRLRVGSIQVPVRFHMFTPNGSTEGILTDETIQTNIDHMNDVFQDFHFHIIEARVHESNVYYNAVIEARDEYIVHIKRQYSDGPHVLHIFTGLESSSVLGVASFPWTFRVYPRNDGVSVNKRVLRGSSTNFGEGNVLIHEVGHWLGLLHTFQGGCEGGDGVADVPNHASATRGCGSPGLDTCPNQPGLDPIRNFMNYLSDSCMTEFTPGQRDRMVFSWDIYRDPVKRGSHYPNDFCSGAASIPLGGSLSGNTHGAHFDLDALSNMQSCNSLRITAPGLWYKVESPIDQTLMASICHEDLKAGTYLAVMSNSCDQLVCLGVVAEDNDDGVCETLVWDAKAKKEYFLYVVPGKYVPSNFTLSVSGGVFNETDTAIPSTSPTTIPTRMQTRSPTASPTIAPSSAPSKSPTAKPTVSPSVAPSKSPTAAPTQAPTRSSQITTTSPSIRPTLHLTPRSGASDLQQKTAKPSHFPSVAPSIAPSLAPSTTPSVLPSLEPSHTPSGKPFSSLSFVPSASPSSTPSSSPSGSPSSAPSMLPSTSPSSSPSSLPSASPSFAPSASPSHLPSSVPSSSPSSIPSRDPSSVPSAAPSSTPSMFPSALPSTEPSGSPSQQPSSQPSALPSSEPSSSPSQRPSSSPSTSPSLTPTIPWLPITPFVLSLKFGERRRHLSESSIVPEVEKLLEAYVEQTLHPATTPNLHLTILNEIVKSDKRFLTVQVEGEVSRQEDEAEIQTLLEHDREVLVENMSAQIPDLQDIFLGEPWIKSPFVRVVPLVFGVIVLMMIALIFVLVMQKIHDIKLHQESLIL